MDEMFQAATMVAVFSPSAWASFMALAKHTINSSITPLILPGLSLSWS